MSSPLIGLSSSESESFNCNKLSKIHDGTMLMAGLSAGILQLESFAGFGMFLGVYTLANLLFIGWMCKFKPSYYFGTPIQTIWLQPLFRELAGFVMTWTFAFTLVR